MDITHWGLEVSTCVIQQKCDVTFDSESYTLQMPTSRTVSQPVPTEWMLELPQATRETEAWGLLAPQGPLNRMWVWKAQLASNLPEQCLTVGQSYGQTKATIPEQLCHYTPSPHPHIWMCR